ncbi:hypothetical protein DICVIV_06683 [Dictyocaulus viviparus]|uniref:Uncharacterized protein n=1 Tax=Dictyocaulus viviparus TaxID=29172 RepID=A0A0D8XU09_DICVI|nr:hypothetical protein DICVIV_06683 [Dictyocaulus viviparus]
MPVGKLRDGKSNLYWKGDQIAAIVHHGTMAPVIPPMNITEKNVQISNWSTSFHNALSDFAVCLFVFELIKIENDSNFLTDEEEGEKKFMVSMMSLSDYGLSTDNIKYLTMTSISKGKGPDHLKYLDLEGRWKTNEKNTSSIMKTLKHLKSTKNVFVSFEDLTDQSLNALETLRSSTSSKLTKVDEKKPTAKFQIPVSVMIDDDDVPKSPREILPHRSAGYGPAHEKRKLSISDRSRSVSPMRVVPSIPTYDKYAKYERNRTDSMTRYGTKWGDNGNDSGYSSTQKLNIDTRPPHRTPSLSPRISTPSTKLSKSTWID